MKITGTALVVAWSLLALIPRFGLSAPLLTGRQVPVPHVCDVSARYAARQTGVPLDVLRAVSRVETGRRSAGVLKPWPWTVNMEGVGKWFPDRLAARTFTMERFKAGARSFDIGCFQINYKWHNQAFRSIDEMFDPNSNALYAAQFLNNLYAEFGNWPDAVGAFHSRTPGKASGYVTRFEAVFSALSPIPLPTAPGRETRTGSLVEFRRRSLIRPGGATVSARSFRSPGSLVALQVGATDRPVFIAMNGATNTALNGDRN